VKRALATLLLGMCVSSCGGSSSSTTTPTPPFTTRVIGLSGNLAFGDVAAGSTATSVLTITNTGNATLTVTGVSAPSAGSGIYTASWTSGTISTGGSQAVTIKFAPAAAISYGGTLTVSADQTSGANTIPISGAGAAPTPTPNPTPSPTPPTPSPTPTPTPTPTPPGGLSCGVERWPVKTLSDADATRVSLSDVTSTTIAALNGLPAHCSGLPDGRTYAEEFRVYEVIGVVKLTRDEDDRDVHIALVDPSDASQTIVVEVADSACTGAVQSPYAATLTSARASYQSLGTLTGRTVRVRGVGFYDFDHGQTGRSRSCIELHPVVSIVLTSAPTPTPALTPTPPPTPTPVPGPNGPTCTASSVPAGVTAVCTDGSFSSSQNRSGTCSSHQGVKCWICPGSLCQ
jgi:hypothetical protein